MNCDNCRWFNKTGFVPGFGDCALNREVHSSKHEACEHYEEYEQRPHEEWTTESAIDYLTNIGWLPEHDRILTERPHGEWQTTPNPNHSPFDSTSEVIYMCSQCAYSSGERITATWHFCPNCGASMSANDRQVIGKLNSEIEKSKSEICPCIECCKIDNSEPCRKGCSDYHKWKEGDEE